MVMIHEAPQSFGSGLIQSLAAAGTDVAKGIQQRNANKALEKLHEEANKQQQIDPATNHPIKQPTLPVTKQVNTTEIYNQARNAGRSHEQALQEIKPYEKKNEVFLKEEAKIREEERKVAREKQEKESENEGLRNSIQFLESKLPEVGKTFGAVSGFNKIFDRQQIQDREEFTATGQQLADTAYSRVNKGVQSTEKIKLWKENWAPNAELSERVNIARINALKRFLNIPENASKEIIKKEEAKASNDVKSAERKKVLNVYQNGNLVGTIDESQASELPQGYEAR